MDNGIGAIKMAKKIKQEAVEAPTIDDATYPTIEAAAVENVECRPSMDELDQIAPVADRLPQPAGGRTAGPSSDKGFCVCLSDSERLEMAELERHAAAVSFGYDHLKMRRLGELRQKAKASK